MSRMRLELVTIGTELLMGQIADGNARYLARVALELGLSLERVTTVADDLDEIVTVLDGAMARSDVVITTGGLGPTEDDLTRVAVARATGCPLELRPELLVQIEAFFAGRGREMPPNNRRQAEIPRGAEAIPNPVGTAPAFAVEHGRAILVSLPGVPREMEYLFRTAVRPLLARRRPPAESIAVRVLHTAGRGESAIDHAIADLQRSTNPMIGTMAHAGRCDLRLVARAATGEAARALIEPVEREIRARLGTIVYGVDGETHEGALARELARRGWGLATDEAATAGAIAARLALDPDGLRVLRHGRVRPDPAARSAREADALSAVRSLATETGCHVALAIVGPGSGDGATWAAFRWPGGEGACELPRGCADEPMRTQAVALALETLRRSLAAIQP